MAMETPAKYRFAAKYCPFVGHEVWAIVVEQPDGRWKIVNCLDKDEHCFSLDCVFTTDGGAWPFTTQDADGKVRVA